MIFFDFFRNQKIPILTKKLKIWPFYVANKGKKYYFETISSRNIPKLHFITMTSLSEFNSLQEYKKIIIDSPKKFKHLI
jgi:CTP:phosphocholine cytidylyltransferase-like protein